MRGAVEPFGAETARLTLSAAQCREVEARARSDAEKGRRAPRNLSTADTYWGEVQEELERALYVETYEKRAARLRRMTRDP